MPASHAEGAPESADRDTNKKARIRERDRKRQAVYRETFKKQETELTNRLNDVHERLRLATKRWRNLRDTRNGLVQRSSSARSELKRIKKERKSNSTAASLSSQPSTSESTAVAPPEEYVEDSKPAPLLLKGIRGPNLHHTDAKAELRFSNEFRCHLPMSCQDIVDNLPPRAAWPGSVPSYEQCVDALERYQQAHASRAGVSVEDISWFVTSPYRDSSLASSNCIKVSVFLSYSLMHFTASFESMFLDELQHSQGEPESKAAFVGDDPIRLDSHPLKLDDGPTPTPPDPSLLSHLQLNVGVDTLHPLGLTVSETILPLLRTYQACLPEARWQRVCTTAMHFACKAAVRALAVCGGPPAAAHVDCSLEGEDSGSGAEASSSAEEEAIRIQSLVQKLPLPSGVMMQQVAWVIHNAMREKRPKAHAVSSSYLEHRVVLLTALQSAFLWITETNAPRYIKRMRVAVAADATTSITQIRRCNMRLYTRLKFSQNQREALAAKWHRYCRRRDLLSQSLRAAVRALSALPDGHSIPPQLHQVLELALKPPPLRQPRQAPLSPTQTPSPTVPTLLTPQPNQQTNGDCRSSVHRAKSVSQPFTLEELYGARQRAQHEQTDGKGQAGLRAPASVVHSAQGHSGSGCLEGHARLAPAAPVHVDTSPVSAAGVMKRPSAGKQRSTPRMPPEAPVPDSDCGKQGDHIHELSGDSEVQDVTIIHVHCGRQVDPLSWSDTEPVSVNTPAQLHTSSHSHDGDSWLAGSTRTCGPLLCNVPAAQPNDAAPCLWQAGLVDAELEDTLMSFDPNLLQFRDYLSPRLLAGVDSTPLEHVFIPRMLGESANLMQVAQACYAGIRDVHQSDHMSHSEFSPYCSVLDGAQRMRSFAAYVDMNLLGADMMMMAQFAAEELRREELFGNLLKL